MENVHTKAELKQYQSLPLSHKIRLTQDRIQPWYESWKKYIIYNSKTKTTRSIVSDKSPKLAEDEYIDECYDGQVFVSFSGGKDSTVLLHIAREMYPDIEAVYVNTGLEYPELQQFVKTFDNVTILRPKMRFDEVIRKYGYPIISKEASERVYNARQCLKHMRGGEYRYIKHYYQLTGAFPDTRSATLRDWGFFSKRYDFSKWKDLLNVDFNISNRCCNIMKKAPLNKQSKKAIVATMAEESQLRLSAWIKTGCNAFEHGISKPMSFWTEQDVLRYIKEYNIPIASIYGDVVYGNRESSEYYENTLFDCGKLCTTGAQRTGCIFCGYGAHLEKGESRFERLKHTHPRQYEYCLEGGAYDPTDGMWKPDKNGLGMRHVFEELNKLYGKDFIRY